MERKETCGEFGRKINRCADFNVLVNKDSQKAVLGNDYEEYKKAETEVLNLMVGLTGKAVTLLKKDEAAAIWPTILIIYSKYNPKGFQLLGKCHKKLEEELPAGADEKFSDIWNEKTNSSAHPNGEAPELSRDSGQKEIGEK